MVYVLSDIHGNLNRYNSIIEQINLQETDILYILGDVIDRYPDGIKILREIIKKDNVKEYITFSKKQANLSASRKYQPTISLTSV